VNKNFKWDYNNGSLQQQQQQTNSPAALKKVTILPFLTD
jgi:hypothetical protein